MHSAPPSPSAARRMRVFTSSDPETFQGVRSSKPSSSRIRFVSAATPAPHMTMRKPLTGSHRKNNSLPFKGRVRVGMGLAIPPHPHPSLPPEGEGVVLSFIASTQDGHHDRGRAPSISPLHAAKEQPLDVVPLQQQK